MGEGKQSDLAPDGPRVPLDARGHYCRVRKSCLSAAGQTRENGGLASARTSFPCLQLDRLLPGQQRHQDRRPHWWEAPASTQGKPGSCGYFWFSALGVSIGQGDRRDPRILPCPTQDWVAWKEMRRKSPPGHVVITHQAQPPPLHYFTEIAQEPQGIDAIIPSRLDNETEVQKGKGSCPRSHS